jgi:uroporphyrinogen-III decarboxylase
MKREIEDAVEQADGHPLIIAPGCSFPSDAPEANLQAVYDALAT